MALVDQFDLHLPTELVILIVITASALLGLLLGLPSWRLIGDYLAIVTLFFAQIFVELMLNLDRLTPPWSDEPLDVTGGPNGIPGIDDMRIFAIDFEQTRDYYFLLLAIFAVVVVGLYYINESRTGRAWRASREDPLAAELMTMPVNRLKLLAFAIGAAVAGLTGSVFAAVQTGVFPQNFEVALLIMIYAALILGGAGSHHGRRARRDRDRRRARDPAHARRTRGGCSTASLIASLLIVVRPWKRVAAIVAAVIVFGFAVHAIVALIWPDAVVGVEDGGLGGLTGLLGPRPRRPRDARQLRRSSSSSSRC